MKDRLGDNSPEAFHEAALGLADQAEIALRRGDSRAARVIFKPAARFEERAFQQAMSVGPHRLDDPQRTVNKAVLGRSAATLYISAGEPRHAARVAKMCLAEIEGMPVYDDIWTEIQEVLDQARSELPSGKVRKLLPRRLRRK